MKKYVKNETNSDMPGVILLSHGKLALSMIDSAKLVAGNIDKCAAIVLEAGDNPMELGEVFIEIYDSFVESIVFVDLMAGTPFNQVCRSMKMREKPIPIVSGFNLPMVLETLMGRANTTVTELQKKAVDAGKSGIVDVTKWMKELENKEKGI